MASIKPSNFYGSLDKQKSKGRIERSLKYINGVIRIDRIDRLLAKFSKLNCLLDSCEGFFRLSFAGIRRTYLKEYQKALKNMFRPKKEEGFVFVFLKYGDGICGHF